MPSYEGNQFAMVNVSLKSVSQMDGAEMSEGETHFLLVESKSG